MQHTPGPWILSSQDGTIKLNRVIYAGDKLLLSDEAYYPTVPDNEADWTLIAAAPKMLQALKRLRNICQPHMSHQEVLMCRIIDEALP